MLLYSKHGLRKKNPNQNLSIYNLIPIGIMIFIVIYLIVVLFIPSGNLLNLLAPEKNRELGVIEGLQNVSIVCIITLLISSLRKFKGQIRSVILVAAFFSLMLLLEETDYFQNYIDIFNNTDTSNSSFNGFRNVHNINGLRYLRRIAYWTLVILTLMFHFYFLKKYWHSISSRPTRIGLTFSFILFLAVQLLLSIYSQYSMHINVFLEGRRQIISETLELNLYVTWLLIASIWIGAHQNNR